MESLALLAGVIFLATFTAGPVAAVAARNNKPILAVFLGSVAVYLGGHWWSAVGPMGLVSVALGAYAVAKALGALE